MIIIGLVDSSFGVAPIQKQTLDDENNDVFQYTNSTHSTLSESQDMDIDIVTYSSNGQTLDATLWFNKPIKFQVSNGFRYTMLIDSDVDFSTGQNGYDYSFSYIYENEQWKQQLNEIVQSQVLPLSETVFDNISNLKYDRTITLSLDLDSIGNPEKFRLIFLVFDPKSQFIDSTNWVEVPTPKYNVLIEPDLILLEPGQTDSIKINLESDSKLIRQSTLEIKDYEKSDLTFDFESNHLKIRPNGERSTTLSITAPENFSQKSYTVDLNSQFDLVSSEYPVGCFPLRTDFCPTLPPTVQSITEQNFFTVKITQSDFLESNLFVNLIGPIIIPLVTGIIGAVSTIIYKKMKK